MSPLSKLIWQQDFVRRNADLKAWNIRIGNDLLDDQGNAVISGWGNGEQQYYTGNSDNLYLDGQGLNLRAKREMVKAADGRNFSYTSARIDTRDSFSFCYGKLIVRAKLPIGAGMWPAIWLLPQDKVNGDWPASGEIDMVEAKGRLQQHVFGTLHYGKDWEHKVTKEFSHVLEGGTISEFHDYALEWNADSIRWLVDEHPFAECQLTPGITPFDVPFYLVLNLAVGGWYDNVPVDEDALPAVMTVSGIWLYE